MGTFIYVLIFAIILFAFRDDIKDWKDWWFRTIGCPYCGEPEENIEIGWARCPNPECQRMLWHEKGYVWTDSNPK